MLFPIESRIHALVACPSSHRLGLLLVLDAGHRTPFTLFEKREFALLRVIGVSAAAESITISTCPLGPSRTVRHRVNAAMHELSDHPLALNSANRPADFSRACRAMLCSMDPQHERTR